MGQKQKPIEINPNKQLDVKIARKRQLVICYFFFCKISAIRLLIMHIPADDDDNIIFKMTCGSMVIAVTLAKQIVGSSPTRISGFKM
jgi:hypothetical protein